MPDKDIQGRNRPRIRRAILAPVSVQGAGLPRGLGESAVAGCWALIGFIIFAVFTLANAGPAPTAMPGPSEHSIRVLIISGQNNHDWKTTTPALAAILEHAGRFMVGVTEKPAALTAASLEPYDVILSNWNAYGLDPASSDWPETAKRAYVDFVRRGKGHVVVHAGSASFPNWKEYLELTLATFKPGQTYHGPRHEFPVRIDAKDHPVTRGLKDFTIGDELWNRVEMTGHPQVLASSFSSLETQGTGRWEPSVLAGSFGEGRSLAIFLGHDAEAMADPDFATLLVRAVEWAATGRVTEKARTAEIWRWEDEKGRSLGLAAPSGLLWRFNYDTALDVPYFHPVNAAGGGTLTWDRPPDHLWHHGLWFSWKFIDTVNYWEIDAKTGHPAGRTTWKAPKIETRKDHSARIALELVYRPAGEEVPVLAEKRTVEVGAPQPDGSYSMDWTCVFEAAKPLVLDRTPLPGEPGGQSWGGYSGLSLRFAKEFAEPQPVSSDGPVTVWTEDRYRGKHTAMDYSGLLEGWPVGAAILDHPSNPRTPTPWYVIRSAEMTFFTPAVLCYAPVPLTPGQPLTLRYRVIVHPGRWDADRLKKEYRRFSDKSR